MRKFFAVVSAAAVLLTGCSAGGEPASTVFSVMRPESVPQSETSALNSGNSDNSAVSGASSSSYDMGLPQEELENASKNIWLFGKKLSLPCRFEEFGVDFSVGDEHSYQMKDDLIVFLYYKGEVIGEVVLENCTNEDPNKAAKKVVQLALGNAADNPVSTEGWYNNEIFFDVLGITMRSKLDDVEKLLGKPSKKRTTGEKTRYVYNISDTKYIEFTFIDEKIVEFVIESR